MSRFTLYQHQRSPSTYFSFIWPSSISQTVDVLPEVSAQPFGTCRFQFPPLRHPVQVALTFAPRAASYGHTTNKVGDETRRYLIRRLTYVGHQDRIPTLQRSSKWKESSDVAGTELINCSSTVVWVLTYTCIAGICVSSYAFRP